MNYEDRPRLSDEEKEAMASQYGNSTREAIKPLTMLMALILAKQDITALAFVCECVGGVMASAIEFAKQIQEARGQHGETLQ